MSRACCVKISCRFAAHIFNTYCIALNVSNGESHCIIKFNSFGTKIYSRPLGPFFGIASENITAIFYGVNVISTSLFFDDTKSISLIVDGDGNRNIAIVIHLKGESEFTIFIGSYNAISCIASEPKSLISRRQLNFLISNRMPIFIYDSTNYFTSIAGVGNKIITNEIHRIDSVICVRNSNAICICASEG